MATLIFDIETIGEDFDALDETTQDVLTRWIKKGSGNDEEFAAALEDLKNELGFSPYTGEIVAIGVLDAEKEKSVVYYQAPGETFEDEEAGEATLKQASEKEMLEFFWKGAGEYNTFVSFNGRGFDVPFLLVRSMVHGVVPSKDLLSNRYLGSQKFDAKHIDLMDQLTFYGAVRRRPNLHLVSRVLGIKSPKADGVSGDDVSGLFRAKRFQDIARYNVGDLVATKAVYEQWKETIAF